MTILILLNCMLEQILQSCHYLCDEKVLRAMIKMLVLLIKMLVQSTSGFDTLSHNKNGGAMA